MEERKRRSVSFSFMRCFCISLNLSPRANDANTDSKAAEKINQYIVSDGSRSLRFNWLNKSVELATSKNGNHEIKKNKAKRCRFKESLIDNANTTTILDTNTRVVIATANLRSPIKMSANDAK